MDLIAQADPTTYLPSLAIYGPLGLIAMLVGFWAWKYVPKILDAMLENIESGKKQAIRNADATERLVEQSEVQTEHMEAISASTLATSQCIEGLGSVNKQQADALSMLVKSSSGRDDPRGPPQFEHHMFSSVQTNKAIEHLAQAKLIETQNPEARRLIELAIEAVRRQKP